MLKKRKLQMILKKMGLKIIPNDLNIDQEKGLRQL
jgi:hypothetical protein